MEANSRESLTKELMKKPYIFICGPSRGSTNDPPETKLRVYAHGGLLCKLPTTKRAAIDLCDENYFKDEPTLLDSFKGLRSGETKEKFLLEHLDKLVEIMKGHFTAKNKSPEERNQQTTIARRHTDFHEHEGTVVCDFQFAVPEKYGPGGEKRPAFDLVTFSMDEPGHGVFTLVEYKCNAEACKSEEGKKGESGLKEHAEDMLHCTTDPKASVWCKEELLRRLKDYMSKYGLLENCPEELEHLTHEDVDLKAGFLFTPGPCGDELRTRHDAAALCEEYIREDIRKDSGFFFCFADSPKDVNLSQMKSWTEFKGD